eukprot:TRINITY_DN43230_c0_g2_i1.p1 TRINITY_DN43230_c0_g2~~TRINITY_DN43230_c0_g2_i1.p1  ORF type:complete len:133 (-),score=5.60 TRINITY_DN43230_c0_g2_i1:308-706(-)
MTCMKVLDAFVRSNGIINQPLIQSVLHFECHLPFITMSHKNPVISTTKINLGEDTSTRHQVQHIIKPINAKDILHCDHIVRLAVYTHSLTSILGSKEGYKWGQALPDITLSQQFINLMLQFGMLSWTHLICW